MIAVAASLFVAILAAAIVAWPLGRRVRVATALLFSGAVTGLYILLGSGFALDGLESSESLNRATRDRLRQHMQEVAARPDDPAVWTSFGRDLMVSGRYTQAAEAYRQAYEHGREPKRLFDILTALYLAAGATLGDDAQPWLDKARSALPNAPETRYFSALRQVALGHPAEAAEALAKLRPEIPAGQPLAVLIDGELGRLSSRIAP